MKIPLDDAAQMVVILDTPAVKIARVDFRDGADHGYVVAMDRPKVDSFNGLWEYIPAWAYLTAVTWRDNILDLTFQVPA